MRTVVDIFLMTAGAVWTLLGIYAVQNYRRNTRSQPGTFLAKSEAEKLFKDVEELTQRANVAMAENKLLLETNERLEAMLRDTREELRRQNQVNARLEESLMVTRSNLESAKAQLQKTA
jgi:hypothetical protein